MQALQGYTHFGVRFEWIQVESWINGNGERMHMKRHTFIDNWI